MTRRIGRQHNLRFPSNPEERFEQELELFRKEVEGSAQCFYAHIAVHAVAAEHTKVRELLNDTPLFWNTCLAALQVATFINLGKVFDQDSPHNLDRLLRIAQDHRKIFSKAALGQRRTGSGQTPTWLDEFLSDAYEPKANDFRRIRKHIAKKRKIWEANYRDLRNLVFAHKVIAEDGESAALFAKTSIRELQRLFAFLVSLYDALWQLFNNGRKPILRPQRYSMKRMRALPLPASVQKTAQEEVTHEVERFLKCAAGLSVASSRSNAP